MWPWPGGVESAGRWRRRILRLSPAALLVSSYLAGMMVGTLLLKMPWATRAGIAWTDALFTATSALCVTGLTVVDTGTFFTTAGQVVILCLIQIGGLGIMTFAVFILVSAGWRLSTQQRFCIQDSFSTDASSDLRRLVLFVVWFAVVAELAGSAALALCLKDLDLGQRLYFGLFHAVSAFCNAGFGLYPDSLARYYDDWLLNFTVAGLIILGGLGFPVLFEVTSWLRQRKRSRFSLHTRLALLSSGVLIGAGLVAFWALEHRNCLAGMPLSVQLLVSFFQSVTPRTAGFATVEFARLSNATLMVIVILMFIGASPGSTGGGVKTTSFAVLVGLLWNRVKGSSYNNMMNCTVPEATVGRAVTVFILSINAIVIALCLLLVTQSEAVPCEQSRGLFLEYLFETVSAFGTVGLSMGKTAQLNAAGKLILTAMMFTGRVGILTLAYVFSSRESRVVYRYAEETVMIG